MKPFILSLMAAVFSSLAVTAQSPRAGEVNRETTWKLEQLRQRTEELDKKIRASRRVDVALEKEHIMARRAYDSLLLVVKKKMEKEKDGFWKKLMDAVTLQNEVDPMPDKPDPAVFQLTFPKEGGDSWLVDAAVGIKLRALDTTYDDPRKGRKSLTFTPLFSYHRNTLVDEVQYNWQTGVSVTLANINRRPHDLLRLGHYATLGLKYNRNVIDTVQSFLFTGQYDIYRSGMYGVNLGTNTYTNSPFLQYFSVTPSYQFQYNFRANSETLEGAIFRPQLAFNYELGTGLRRVQWDARKKLSATLGYTMRYDAVNSTGVREYYTHLFKGGLNVFLLNDPVKLTVSGSFQYGSDPAKGLKEQQFWLLGLKLQKS